MAQFTVMKISTMCWGFFGLFIVEVEDFSASKLIFILVNKQKAVRQIVGREDLHFMGFGWYAYIRIQNFAISRILQRVLRSKQSNFLPLKAQFVRNNYSIANQLETLDRL